MRRTRIRLSLLCLLLLMLAPQLVSAHAKYVSSTPGSGERVKAAPASITALFSEELDPDGSSMTVLDAKGARMDQGPGEVDLNNLDRNTMVVALKSGLGDGTYTVNWTTQSAEDGDTAEGSFTFVVAASQPAVTKVPATPAPADDEDEDEHEHVEAPLPATGAPTGPAPWLVALGLIIGLGGLVLRGRRPAQE